jgi:hypothetical protein
MQLFDVLTSVILVAMGPMVVLWLTVSVAEKFEAFKQIRPYYRYQVKDLSRPGKGWSTS